MSVTISTALVDSLITRSSEPGSIMPMIGRSPFVLEWERLAGEETGASTAISQSRLQPIITSIDSGTGNADTRETIVVKKTSDPSLRRTRELQTAYGKIGDYLGGRQSTIISVLSLAALVSNVDYLGGPAKQDFVSGPITAWVDRSSDGTWDSVIPTTHDPTDTRTASASTVATPGARPHLALEEIAPPVDDQPRYNYREAMIYARAMGLKTEFPL